MFGDRIGDSWSLWTENLIEKNFWGEKPTFDSDKNGDAGQEGDEGEGEGGEGGRQHY